MEEYYYYYIPQPPFLLVGLGLFIALTSGFAFQSTLKLKARGIVANNDDIHKQLSTIDLQLPLFGIGMGMSIFLASGLEVFFYPRLVCLQLVFTFNYRHCGSFMETIGASLCHSPGRWIKSLRS